MKRLLGSSGLGFARTSAPTKAQPRPAAHPSLPEANLVGCTTRF